MKEEIIRLRTNDELLNKPCGECYEPFAEDDEVVICPRCKQVHHLNCWIQRGGCARFGCRQVMSPQLRPPKEDKPITVKKVPRWILWAAAVACLALAVGVYINSQRAAALRESSAYVLISTRENESTWNRLIEVYNETAEGQFFPARLILTPAGAYYDQKLLIMIAANDSPEFAVLEEDRLSVFMEQGALERLDHHYFDVESALSLGVALDQEMLARATSADGGLYGVPHPHRPAYLVIPRSPRNQEATLTLFPFLVRALYDMDK